MPYNAYVDAFIVYDVLMAPFNVKYAVVPILYIPNTSVIGVYEADAEIVVFVVAVIEFIVYVDPEGNENPYIVVGVPVSRTPKKNPSFVYIVRGAFIEKLNPVR